MNLHALALVSVAPLLLAPRQVGALRAHGTAAKGAATSPLTADDWKCIQNLRDEAWLRAIPTHGGLVASNPIQQWTTQFDTRGFTTQSAVDEWTWGLELVGFGVDRREQMPKAPAPAEADGCTIRRDWSSDVQEWYLNRPEGLEHGFTIQRPPVEGDRLTLSLAVRGALRPSVSADGRDITFASDSGKATLQYSGLAAYDADGKPLPARWDTSQQILHLSVDQRGARYPVTIDPVAQNAYVKASNTGAGDEFGSSVAISGNTMVIGASYEDSSSVGVNGSETSNGTQDSGAVYVYVKSSGVWTQQAYLKASNTGAGDLFGESVAISGDTIVVGAYFEDSAAVGVGSNESDNSAANAGAAYVFVRNGNTWAQQAYLKASNTAAGDEFGESVAISGDTIVVGAREQGGTAGAAYVFVRSGATWSQQAFIQASNPGAGDDFGNAVSISGDTIAIGADREDSNATGINGNQANNSASSSGAVYVFVRNGSVWTQQAYIKASNSGAIDYFGRAISLSGDTLVVGAHQEDSTALGTNGDQTSNGAADSGAAYVFVRSAGVWSQQAYLKASNTESGDWFGFSVAVSGDVIVVGATLEDSSSTGIDGNQTVAGASSSGAAYVFTRAGSTWSQLSYVKASNTGPGDWFGNAVAIFGGTAVVGAFLESSNGTGINGVQDNNIAGSAGAAYVYYLGFTPNVSVYGTGSPGCSGTHTLDTTTAPFINSPQFGFTCDNAPPSTLGLGILTNAPDFAGSDPLFIGVILHVDLFGSTELYGLDFVSDALGMGAAPAPIPNVPALVGSTYYCMALWAWSSCSLPPYNLSTSRGLMFTVAAP